jgi:hypothetical protein
MAAERNMNPPVRRDIPPLTCRVCGSVWFRLATFMASDHPHSRLQAPLAVCLCGTPVTPQLSGIRQPADQQEIDRLCAALAIDRRLRQAIPDDTVLPDLSAGSTLARAAKRPRPQIVANSQQDPRRNPGSRLCPCGSNSCISYRREIRIPVFHTANGSSSPHPDPAREEIPWT